MEIVQIALVTLGLAGMTVVVYALFCSCWPDSSNQRSGDDAFYDELGHKSATMWVKFEYDCPDAAGFQKVIGRMAKNVRAYLDAHLPIPKADEPAFAEMLTNKPSSWPKLDDVGVVSFRSHMKTRSWYLAFNHATCGGGDFLRVGAAILEADVAELFDPPSRCMGLACLIATLWWCTRNGVNTYANNLIGYKLPLPIKLNPDPKKWYCSTFSFKKSLIKKGAGETKKVSSRVRVAHRMLSAICDALPMADKRPIRVWFPVGFKATKTVTNSVGIIMAHYSKGESAASLEKTVAGNKVQALGTYWGFTMFRGKKAARHGKDGRAWVDVVVSMANVTNAKNLGNGNGLKTVFAMPAFRQSYAIYCSAVTVDDDVYGGVSVATLDFDQARFAKVMSNVAPVSWPWGTAPHDTK